MSRRLDRRRIAVPAILLGTLIFGYAAFRAGGGVDSETTVAVDPHLANSAILARDDAGLHQSFQKAVALLQAGEFEYAVKGFHDVLRVSPEMPEAHVNMGFALLGLDKYEEAKDFFLAASGLRPMQFNSYYGLAIAHEGLGELRQAVAAMRTYTHLADEGDPYRRSAEAAIWEWEAALATAKE